MTYDDELPIGETNFLSHLPARFFKREGSSLAELSRTSSQLHRLYASNLNKHLDEAWATAINRLTCEQARLLATNGMGLKWLADPIAEFVFRYPHACITHYPGDLTMGVWSQFEKLKAASPKAAQRFLSADFSWTIECFTFSRALKREAEALIEASIASA